MSTGTLLGFTVSSFTVKEDKVKATLKALKDEIRFGDGSIADVLESLELHSTASDSSNISIQLVDGEESTRSTSYEFSVSNFSVKQDEIILNITASVSEIGSSVARSLAIHSSEERELEITLQRAEGE